MSDEHHIDPAQAAAIARAAIEAADLARRREHNQLTYQEVQDSIEAKDAWSRDLSAITDHGGHADPEKAAAIARKHNGIPDPPPSEPEPEPEPIPSGDGGVRGRMPAPTIGADGIRQAIAEAEANGQSEVAMQLKSDLSYHLSVYGAGY